MWKKIKKYQFLFEELVKRDFMQKYKRTALGMAWSIMSPLLQLAVLWVVFSNFFGTGMEHYITYLFAGNLLFNYYREATTGGMNALLGNAHIFTKVNVPKYMFLLSKNVSAIINFALSLIIFFVFAFFDGVVFQWKFILLVYPIACLTLLNVGVGLILSAMFVFFRDIGYLYDVFTMLLMYMSAIFYDVESFPEEFQRLFLLNPVYCCIKYVRVIVVEGNIPSLQFHFLCLFYALLFLIIGGIIYKKKNHQFLYYV